MSSLKMKRSLLQAPGEDLIEYEQQIEDAKIRATRQGSTKKDTQNEIKKLKQSFSKTRTSTSLNTIFALVNSMVGSVCLVIPISGLILSIIIMLVIGLISMKTSQLYLRHLREGETNLSDLIVRTLGKKYGIMFNFCSSLLMFLVGNIYFILINQTAYPMICFILNKFGANTENYVSQDDMNTTITFNKFSIQWMSVIIIICIFPLFLIKNMKIIMQLAHGGFFAIGLYVCFIIYTFFENLISGRLQNNYQEMNYFSANITEIAGSFSLAFMVHNAIAQIMSQNSHIQNNNRDMSIGYLLAAGIYALIGIFGSFGIVGRDHPENSYTISQYFPSDSIPPFIINLFFALHLITAYPLFCYISKTQFFNILYPTTVTPKWAILIYNFVFGGSCFLMCLFNVNPGIVIGITGAFVGFVIVYLLPILIHMKCIYFNVNHQQIENVEIEDSTQDPLLCAKESSLTYQFIIQCGNHNIEKRNIYLRGFFYLVIIGIGVYLAVIQLIPIFQK